MVSARGVLSCILAASASCALLVGLLVCENGSLRERRSTASAPNDLPNTCDTIERRQI